MEVTIKKIEDTAYSLTDVYYLIKDIYREREASGIRFFVSRASLDEYLHSIEGSIVFVALEKGNGNLIGSGKLHVVRKGRHTVGVLSNVAVLKAYQRQHIGTDLFEVRKEESIRLGCHHLISSTATNATSSVNWHKKIGWHKIGFKESRNNGCCSYVYYYPLTRYDLYHIDLCCQVRFWSFYVIRKVVPKKLIQFIKDESNRN